jgi:hypothetical protein
MTDGKNGWRMKPRSFPVMEKLKGCTGRPLDAFQVSKTKDYPIKSTNFKFHSKYASEFKKPCGRQG